MKRKQMVSIFAVAVLAAAIQLGGCGKVVTTESKESAVSSVIESTDVSENASANAGETESKTQMVTETKAEPETRAETETDDANVVMADASVKSDTGTLSDADTNLFSERDLAQSADLSGAKTISVSDGDTASIAEAGVYVLTGNAKNASVVIEAGDDDKVQIVLDGVSIVNTTEPCILVENADKVFITSAEGSENSLSVSGEFSGDEDAVIFSKDDLVLNGLGTVNISSSKDGICTNDDLKLTGGTWIVNASDSALKAHDGIYAWDGEYELKGGNDGLHAENNDDDTVGCIVIEGGSFRVEAGDDAVHATTSVTIKGGSLTLVAAEGMEATQVIIYDGTVSINAADDGINAGRKSNSMSPKIEIGGGEITIVMGSGDTDAVDSNGDLIISGGTIDITGQSAFDYDGTCSHTGGTIIVNGTQTDSVTNQMMGGQRGGFMGKMR
ncbi:MAG: carbohydrate-binding domain-containing protein [Lachnospiraceae bacterium]|nr:carbohydrate-binding domain-containing protein [Lachnospiraceae bacterium]